MINIDDTTFYTIEEIMTFAQKKDTLLDTTRPSFQCMMNDLICSFKVGEKENGN